MNDTPLVLDFDGSAGVPHGALVVPLADWHQRIRFGCSQGTYAALRRRLRHAIPREVGPVFTGSGDFHHTSLLLIERLADQGPLDVVVLDNHPDNMRYPWGIHCGSWVSHVARLPFVRQVLVMGITSSDVSLAHAWENRLGALWRGRVQYWCVGRDTDWTRALGLRRAIRGFATPNLMLDAFAARQAASRWPVYLSIDKDVLAADVARTNWDQGVMDEQDMARVIDAVGPRLVGCDVSGDVSLARYEARWKRWLSRIDAQPDLTDFQVLQSQAVQHRLNQRLAQVLASARRSVG